MFIQTHKSFFRLFSCKNIGELVTLQEQGFFFFLFAKAQEEHGKVKAFNHIYDRGLFF